MASPRATWAALSGPRRALAIAIPVLVVAGIVAGVATFGGPAAVGLIPTPGPSPTLEALPPEPSPASPEPGVSPLPTLTPLPPGADPVLGTDGRLTILLLGSDYRPAHPGNRTDAIMVVSIDPVSGAAAAFSVPRDTVQFPLPGGGRYADKVTGLYQHFLSTTSNGSAAMKAAVSKAFRIEVDDYVFIGFEGVKRLVRAVGGVDVTLAHAYYDPEYWVNAHHQGWGLPAGRSHLGPDDALIFARSRKGDNDFGRARRQQMLVMAALTKVRTLGVARLPQLLAVAAQTVRTDLPLSRAATIFEIVSQAKLSSAQKVVFGPRTFANGLGGTTFALNIPVCLAWIKKYFPPVRALGAWPPIVPAPGASPSGSPTP
jgi:polyisoprenyl-teichoic acid--peptidoglycan teichoic acid transferase